MHDEPTPFGHLASIEFAQMVDIVGTHDQVCEPLPYIEPPRLRDDRLVPSGARGCGEFIQLARRSGA